MVRVRRAAVGAALLVLGSAAAAEWEPCDLESCTCAGFCLESLRGQTFTVPGLLSDHEQHYLVRICDALPGDADALPTPGDPHAGSYGCTGCSGVGAPNCTVVRTGVPGNPDSQCSGVGTSDPRCDGFESKCGMSGQPTVDGGLRIRYQYDYEGKEHITDEFILIIKNGPKHLGNITESQTTADPPGPITFTSEWSLPQSNFTCAGEPEPESHPECPAVCKRADKTLKPISDQPIPDQLVGASETDQIDSCCCEGKKGFLIIFGCCIAMFYMFVGLAIVCEEYFVPSLNVLCEKLNMSDDVAGATFMAAGASSPEMFASLIGVLDNSAVGAGTVVGSELFNMLVIVGAVCLFTGSAGLALDWRPLIREVGFFMASLFLLIFVLWDERVQFWEGILLVCGYGGYVVVCAQYGVFVRHLCPIKAGDTTETGGLEQPFLPDAESQSSINSRQQQRVTMDGSMFGFEYGQVLMHGFLFKSSRYYTKIRMSGSKWQRRWFILTDDEYDEKTNIKKAAELRYCKNPLFAGRTSSRSIPIKSATKVERRTPTEFELHTPGETFTFKAQKPEMAEAWVEKLQMKVDDVLRESSIQQLAEQHQSVEEHPTVLAWPDTLGRKVLYVATFPMLVAFYMTIPDVRRARWTNYYPATMSIAVLYLALLAKFMMQAAEEAGCLSGVPGDLMGLTVSAAGTSLPNLFASVLVARQGLGNMAVSNAFGSNTFNIFIALGFPWLVGTWIRSPEWEDCGGDHMCFHVNKGNIFGSCLILVGVLTIFLLALGMTRMKLTPMIGVAYLVVYGIFIVYLCLSTIDDDWKLPF